MSEKEQIQKKEPDSPKRQEKGNEVLAKIFEDMGNQIPDDMKSQRKNIHIVVERKMGDDEVEESEFSPLSSESSKEPITAEDILRFIKTDRNGREDEVEAQVQKITKETGTMLIPLECTARTVIRVPAKTAKEAITFLLDHYDELNHRLPELNLSFSPNSIAVPKLDDIQYFTMAEAANLLRTDTIPTLS